MEIETKKGPLTSAVERKDWDECLKLILEFKEECLKLILELKENSNATKPTS